MSVKQQIENLTDRIDDLKLQIDPLLDAVEGVKEKLNMRLTRSSRLLMSDLLVLTADIGTKMGKIHTYSEMKQAFAAALTESDEDEGKNP